MAELTEITGSQRQALDLVGVARSTWHYRQNPRETVTDPIPQSERAYEARISDADRAQIEERILAGWAADNSVDHAFATAWDEGIMLGSRRTWWRIAADIEDQMLRPAAGTRKDNRQARDKPVLKATGPGQVWSWDITDLYSPWRGKTFKGYKIIDIFSRDIVGHTTENREADHLAVAMFDAAIARHGAPAVVHADSGAAMRSNLLRDALTEHGVTLSHNRPYTSNDNPFSEAGFRTMKYRPGYPRVFTDLDTARAYIDKYVDWYNTEHKHSGIALFSPAQVHDGTWKTLWAKRDIALQRYYDAHPERFRSRPVTPSPADHVGINLPNKEAVTI
ncbi:DDE-type integrase/transposase/recombinase [Microbacterium halophytorum]|uniref:DDE-type integrase/transposase/recombinase n=1 Tax=Microbacterium halophytorum TaxID=2067568 RepID=UPI000CFC760F|nr:DDE-type integrase/transposase/recombinase [Microbacterium halophytorum]